MPKQEDIEAVSIRYLYVKKTKQKTIESVCIGVNEDPSERKYQE